MSSLVAPPVARAVRFLLGALLVLTLSACAALGVRDPLNIQVVGVEPLPGEGLEMRFAVKLRVQNPNTTPIDYDGIALELKVNERSLARGVSAQSGSVPRFGETVLVVPVSISAFAAVRQALGLAENARLDSLPYVLRGKLGGGLLGGRRFSDAGTLDLSAVGKARR
ncbi:Late embryogenesis abundant protein [compost metagenome]|jgi:LEA14-like dessication related protein|uniref:Late embryogenesis abundant protein n=1 Tax=Pseudomonas linyingensis TaxID=915471 RepID=A0A1H6XYX5_9PSED|nr:LEA type 2 family protein [Pseudomonas linyingensis]SEJ33386.1 Late embryogenesis abundant protein [Pseudomonas linyingensis]